MFYFSNDVVNMLINKSKINSLDGDEKVLLIKKIFRIEFVWKSYVI